MQRKLGNSKKYIFAARIGTVDENMDQKNKEPDELRSCLVGLMEDLKVGYELKEVDLSHTESIWYQVQIKTRTQSGLKMVMHLFRDAVGLVCNDYQIFIYSSETPSDFKEWMEYFPKIISAIFRHEIRFRGRRSIFSGKNAAIWLDLPEGGKWMGDIKASEGSGREFVFRHWF